MNVSIIDGQVFVTLNSKTIPAAEAILMLRARQADACGELHKAETALVDAEHDHVAALADGEEPDRDIVTAAKVDIDLARKAVKTIEADLSRVHSEVIGHEAARMIDTDAEKIEQDTGIRPDLTEALARRAAELGLLLSAAEVGYNKAQAEAESARSRVNGVEQRIGEITRKRLAGDATDTDASELAALDYDTKALRELLDQSNQKAALLDPSDLRAQHQRAADDWNSHIRDAMLKALASVIQSREKELVDALTRLADSAHNAGIQNLGDVWRPSDQLRTFTTRTLLSALQRIAA